MAHEKRYVDAKLIVEDERATVCDSILKVNT